MRFPAWVFLYAVLAGCALAPRQVAAPTSTDPALGRESYKLGTGDRIRIEVFGEPDLSTEETLEALGTINYPLLGRIQAAGLTLKDLEQSIAGRLRQGYLVNPSIRATIVQFRPIYVVGQVHHAGSFPYSEGLTVEKAVALAGGLTPIASSRKIYVLHEGAAEQGRQHASLETPVYPGDTIVVEESLF